MKMTCAIAVVALTGSIVSAHDLYLMPETFHLEKAASVNIAVHNGDGFPDSQSAPPMARLKDAQLVAAGKSYPLKDLHADGKRAVGQAPEAGSGHLLATITVAANSVDMDAKEFLEYVQEEGLQHVIAWRTSHGEAEKNAKEKYSKFAKTIVLAGKGDGGFAKAAGLPIEFVPQADPFLAKKGASLPVKVLFKGAPVADLQVIAATPGSKPRVIGRTSASGVVEVPLDSTGAWRLHTVLMERAAAGVDADWESYWATLTFEVR